MVSNTVVAIVKTQLFIFSFSVFVGYTDIRNCNFENAGLEDCIWTLDEGVVTMAGEAPSPLPSSDASNNAQGYKNAISID